MNYDKVRRKELDMNTTLCIQTTDKICYEG